MVDRVEEEDGRIVEVSEFVETSRHVEVSEEVVCKLVEIELNFSESNLEFELANKELEG